MSIYSYIVASLPTTQLPVLQSPQSVLFPYSETPLMSIYCSFVSLRSKPTAQLPVLQSPQSVLFPYSETPLMCIYCSFVSLRSKPTAQLPVLQSPQSVLFPYSETPLMSIYCNCLLTELRNAGCTFSFCSCFAVSVLDPSGFMLRTNN
jgi:hypothetical protein